MMIEICIISFDHRFLLLFNIQVGNSTYDFLYLISSQ